ncbi:Carboxynorspermidine decarboxylase [Herminiimonas arsenicoxydans]|uniref:Carboxynorspermidine/carboxyspermidine decarboxylase n=1 Tax=Herminiimonas arsenicoxydans TaxID=204773 RepID=NSPC_HERAR|nr:RecName: Full=Carboxynorspermidine/carboxyspermidine decarboxylase; Short=CANS DC/CAS DC; Short=CANSDC/CASDC [Herminiimonas arsenicoxydans]AAV68371.1 putative carboxynorspermide decarboxylase [Herminiimonas arsenicoxydans]CAL61021.1 Carboxynorspermidine decarboxylase [Herminiimonas arsenicoxydans]
MISTPYYLIDKSALLRNLQVIDQVRERSGAKVLLALKCFATWSVFDLMQQYMDGTTSSSLYEVKLGHQKFGGETHAYSVAFADHEIDEVVAHCDKIIFNSISQFQRFSSHAGNKPKGLRLNPGVSCASFDLADPARPFSRLGESDPARILSIIDQLDGVMIHNNCENRDFERFDALLTEVEQRYGEILHRLSWVSLGGGISFTTPGYSIDAFCERLRRFAQTYDVQVYLEPGEATVRDTTTLEVSVVDIGFNGKNLAVVDSSTEAHMLDLLIYRETAPIKNAQGDHAYQICGKTCLAGDIFGEARFEQPLQIGDRISIGDAGGYTMVKKNWFNGVHMPAIAIKEADGSVRAVREFSFDDYVSSLS